MSWSQVQEEIAYNAIVLRDHRHRAWLYRRASIPGRDRTPARSLQEAGLQARMPGEEATGEVTIEEAEREASRGEVQHDRFHGQRYA